MPGERYAILTRVEAKTYEEALAAMMAKARALGYEPICASCHPIHLPGWWEGAVEIEEPKQCTCLNRDFSRYNHPKPIFYGP